MNKRYGAGFVAGLLMLGMGGAANALTVELNSVGSEDQLVAWASLSNSGASTELLWMNQQIFGADTASYYTGITKTEGGADWVWYDVVDNGIPVAGTYAFQFVTNEPAYFLIKIGNKRGELDHFLYRNDVSLDWGVVNLSLNLGESGTFQIMNIDKLSHLGEVGAAPVPEPATMLLFGTGLLGLAAIGRRRKL